MVLLVVAAKLRVEVGSSSKEQKSRRAEMSSSLASCCLEGSRWYLLESGQGLRQTDVRIRVQGRCVFVFSGDW